jgi:hypothetical protein
VQQAVIIGNQESYNTQTKQVDHAQYMKDLKKKLKNFKTTFRQKTCKQQIY